MLEYPLYRRGGKREGEGGEREEGEGTVRGEGGRGEVGGRRKYNHVTRARYLRVHICM